MSQDNERETKATVNAEARQAISREKRSRQTKEWQGKDPEGVGAAVQWNEQS